MLFDPCGASKVLPLATAFARNTSTAVFAWLLISAPIDASGQRQLPRYLADRGDGIATSMFGEYVAVGELLVYPFYEFTSFQQMEYKPAELGFGVDQDFRGKFREHEANFFLAYSASDRFALEVESALFTWAKLWKDPADPSAMPAAIQESGFGDTQAEIRYRFGTKPRRARKSSPIWKSTFRSSAIARSSAPRRGPINSAPGRSRGSRLEPWRRERRANTTKRTSRLSSASTPSSI
jgi:hypothetical protein